MSELPEDPREQMAWRRDPDTEEPPEPAFDVTLEQEETNPNLYLKLLEPT
jgi:hypothetical protein